MRIYERIILFLISVVESIEYFYYEFDQNNIAKKIINTVHLKSEFTVLTDTGYQPLSELHITQPYQLYRLKTISGKFIDCADNHIIYMSDFQEIFVSECKIGQLIITKDGPEQIISIDKLECSVSMFDCTVNSNDHRFYTNDILSHNTTTTTIFLAWFLCFHYDKNAFFLANKNDTVLEIVDKTKKVMQYLPFFLKPGVINKTQRSLVLDNGSRLKSQATSEKSAIGDTIHLLYIDEFAHVDDSFAKDFWDNVYPTLSSSKISRIILTSTPNGRNLFYQIYKGAVEKRNGFKYFKIPWWRRPGRDERWKDEEIAALGGGEVGIESFNQQYGCQFLASSSLLLSEQQLKLLDKLKTDYTFKPFDDLDEYNINYDKLKWKVDFPVFDLKNHYIVYSIDAAEGHGGDFSIINIFDLVLKPNFEKMKNKSDVNSIYDFFSLMQVGVFRSNYIEIDDFAILVYFLITKVANPERLKTVLEYNTYGSDLEYRLFNMFDDDNEMDDSCFVKYHHTNNSKTKKIGLKIRLDNKPLNCSKFKELVDKSAIIINEQQSIEEAGGFGKGKNGTYQGQLGNDDLMMSSINAGTVFDTPEFKNMVDEYFDTLPEEIKKKILSILERDTKELNDDIYDSVSDGSKDMSDDIFGDDEDDFGGSNKDEDDWM